MRGIRAFGSVLFAVAVVAGSPGAGVAAPGEPGVPRFGPGDDGAGDPYFPLAGNGGYDVTHYDLDIDYQPPDPAPAPLEGTMQAVATLSVTPTENLDQFNLDLRGLEVESVVVRGRPARFTRDDGELVVTPRPKMHAGRPVQVEVTYGGTTGRPTDIEGALYGWVTTRDGAMVANEPEGASTWYPVSDHPTDKATYDFEITVPEGLVAVANGELVGSRTSDGTTTWTWSSTEPMASYLSTASVGNYELRTSTTPDGLPLIDAIDRDLAPEASAGLAQTAEMVEFFEGEFGPYPFGSYGAIVDDDSIGYALETQTRPIYSRRANEGTVAHELAHQWMGNSVSPERWGDIWLNEGWATYASWIWAEHDGGDTAQQSFDDVMAIPADDDFWQTVVADPGPTGLFAGAVYSRGAATLYALRQRIGEQAFGELSRQWPARFADSTATTADFEALAEEMSGQDLGAFFDTWIHSPGKPT
ncbi:peptidase M1-like protein [Haloactinopolyspora alba]|uniref:Aminopeptidase N n=1 Tax=Haloactinopolyspora alba TaxID=648780 RepID=A0A2P8DJ26_9ACTN|nr:M1 family metallopeptidase [Haloactinopolyspora alba]PSK97232.1 peptidase M1-like protein [Haloactinopolyspora alba]